MVGIENGQEHVVLLNRRWGMCVQGEIAMGRQEPTQSDEECVELLEESIIDPMENRGHGRAGKKKRVLTNLELEK
jgi:hypothetical protein